MLKPAGILLKWFLVPKTLDNQAPTLRLLVHISEMQGIVGQAVSAHPKHVSTTILPYGWSSY